jgi:hypothetical protein
MQVCLLVPGKISEEEKNWIRASEATRRYLSW